MFKGAGAGAGLEGKARFKDKHELVTALNMWCDDKTKAVKQYGAIKDWDTSLITDMRCGICGVFN